MLRPKTKNPLSFAVSGLKSAFVYRIATHTPQHAASRGDDDARACGASKSWMARVRNQRPSVNQKHPTETVTFAGLLVSHIAKIDRESTPGGGNHDRQGTKRRRRLAQATLTESILCDSPKGNRTTLHRRI